MEAEGSNTIGDGASMRKMAVDGWLVPGKCEDCHKKGLQETRTKTSNQVRDCETESGARA